ncbi:hypothetical protein BDN70DRAFT_795490, partial [Pholiota conissans]
DAYRLPEGFKRTGFDADTRRYHFRDSRGVLYQSEPEMEYGPLTPVESTRSAMDVVRPGAFLTSLSANQRTPSLSPPQSTPMTFHDILPPELITSSTLSDANEHRSRTSSKPPREKFVEAVKKSGLPKMQGVVNNLKRSVTSMRRPRAAMYAHESEEIHHGLMHRNRDSTSANATGPLDRSTSMDTTLTVDPRNVRDPEHKILKRQ